MKTVAPWRVLPTTGKFRLQVLPLPRNSGATSSAPSSTTGCATMWVRPLWKSSTAHLPTGWGCCQACAYSKECGHAGVMEHNGDVYSCDHFVFPEYKLGNIRAQSLIDMLYGEKQQVFSRLKHTSLPRQCKECDMEFACHGECPKNRFEKDKYGEPGLNYLCQGYYQYYTHVAPYMDFMKRELLAQRPPANIMNVLKNN